MSDTPMTDTLREYARRNNIPVIEIKRSESMETVANIIGRIKLERHPGFKCIEITGTGYQKAKEN